MHKIFVNQIIQLVTKMYIVIQYHTLCICLSVYTNFNCSVIIVQSVCSTALSIHGIVCSNTSSTPVRRNCGPFSGGLISAKLRVPTAAGDSLRVGKVWEGLRELRQLLPQAPTLRLLPQAPIYLYILFHFLRC